MTAAVKTSFLTLLVFFFSTIAFSQNDSIPNAKKDSILNTQQDQTKKMMSAIDSINMSDSIQQIVLQQQINELTTRDKRKKARLQFKIDSLKNVQVSRDLKAKQEIDSLRANAKGVPVLFFKDTVYYIYSKLGSFSPSERAERIQHKLENLINNNSYKEELLIIEEGEDSFDLIHGDVIITSITNKDAFWEDKPKKEIAESLRALLVVKIKDYQAQNNFFALIIRIVVLVLTILIFYFLIKYLNKGIKYVNEKIKLKFKHNIKGIKFKNYEFLSTERELQIIDFLFKVFRYFVIAFVLYLSLPVVFSIFPSTKSIADTLIGLISSPLKNIFFGFVSFIPSLIAIVIIIFVAKSIVRFLGFLALEIEKKKLKIPGFYPDWAKPTFNLLKIIIYAFSFVVIFPYLPGSDSNVFQGVSVFLGVLISLGSSSAIGNIIAGLVITYMRAFKIGDRVKIADTTGDVIEKTMLVTRIRTAKNEDITIPNASILNGSTINYSSSATNLGLILHTTVTIGYDVPWPQVHELLISAATSAKNVLDDPKPFVLQTSLDDFYVSYELNAYTKKPKLSAKTYSEIHANIQDNFNSAQIEILSPHYRAERDGSGLTIPPNYITDKK
ncbi:mechanosensitive ion channel family protein [Flavicella sediminum]|uniref:mechanosensitive ion channel family protein n=1 Tax=Flavicella sediminum TaxID=2585141 RepID=UPI0011241073|nr:mechanosensitive ion channel family protein [Flavicella sediminum]